MPHSGVSKSWQAVKHIRQYRLNVSSIVRVQFKQQILKQICVIKDCSHERIGIMVTTVRSHSFLQRSFILLSSAIQTINLLHLQM